MRLASEMLNLVSFSRYLIIISFVNRKSICCGIYGFVLALLDLHVLHTSTRPSVDTQVGIYDFKRGVSTTFVLTRRYDTIGGRAEEEGSFPYTNGELTVLMS